MRCTHQIRRISCSAGEPLFQAPTMISQSLDIFPKTCTVFLICLHTVSLQYCMTGQMCSNGCISSWINSLIIGKLPIEFLPYLFFIQNVFWIFILVSVFVSFILRKNETWVYLLWHYVNVTCDGLFHIMH